MARKFGSFVLIALILAAAGWAFHEPVLGAIGSYLVLAEDPVRADIGLVLAGDGQGNRVLKAGELVKQKFIPHVLVSGPDGNYGFYECDLAIPFAVKAGYPASYFAHFENTARSTEEEARMAVEELRRRRAHHILIITSDYHTRRAGRMYRRLAPDLEFTVVAAPDHDFTARNWWRNREGRKIALYEWMKTVAAWFGI